MLDKDFLLRYQQNEKRLVELETAMQKMEIRLKAVEHWLNGEEEEITQLGTGNPPTFL